MFSLSQSPLPGCSRACRQLPAHPVPRLRFNTSTIAPRRFKPTKYVREYLDALGSHERVVHIRVGDGAGPDGEGPCHVSDSRINLSAGMAALQEAILDHWKVPLANASSILLLSDCSEVYNGLEAFSQPPWGWLHHSNVGASVTELEQTWAEWLAMVNATEIMHTPRCATIQGPLAL